MKRYLHLYFTCVKRSIISRLEYKKDTFIAIFSFFISNVASLLSIYFIINSIPSLDGWDMYELGFLYGFSMLPIAIDHLFSDDLWCVSYYKVKNGELDRCFLRPVPVLFQVIAETFQPEGFGELIIGIIMLIVCGININISFTFDTCLLFFVSTIFGAIVITSLKIIFASLAFVFKKSGPLLQIIYNFLEYTRYPISIFPHIIQIALTFIIPFGLIISLPIQTIIFGGESKYMLCLLIIIVSLIMLLISIVIWTLCERKYESTGS